MRFYFNFSQKAGNEFFVCTLELKLIAFKNSKYKSRKEVLKGVTAETKPFCADFHTVGNKFSVNVLAEALVIVDNL